MEHEREKERKGRFCVVPFILVNTRGHGEARVCCTISDLNRGIPKNATLPETADQEAYLNSEKFDLKKDKISELWNSKFMRDFRKRMLSGEYINNCRDCFRLEDNGLTSKRLTKNKIFLEQLKKERILEKCEASAGYMEQMPRWWEIRISTKCNLSCYMCSPRLSSKIYREFIKNKNNISRGDWKSVKSFTKLYQRENPFLGNSAFFKEQFFKNINSVTHLEMRGGEVLFDKDSVSFLEKISHHPRSKHIHFDISTNATIFTPTIIAIFNRFKKGTIRFSIDGFGKENEYMRYPTKWPIIVDTLTKSDSLEKKFTKLIQVTLNVFQVCTIHKLLWFIDSFISKNNGVFLLSFSLVRGTPHLSHELVPLELRRESANHVKNFLNTSDMCNLSKDKKWHRKAVLGLIQTILSENKPAKDAKKLFFEKIPPLDKIRNQNYLEIFPHLKILQELKH